MSAVGVRALVDKNTDIRPALLVRCDVNGSARKCRILELDSNQAFIESFVPAVTGSIVTLQFNLPNGYEINAKGTVSDHQFTVGFKVDFNYLPSSDREQIEEFLG
jgi:hypothetical protein